MSNSWDDYAADWDHNESVREYCEKAFATLVQHTSLQGKRVLDFGCGTGLLSARLAEQADTVVALDASEKMIQVLAAKQVANLSCIASELSDSLIARTPALQSGFDVIVASSALAFVPDYPHTLALLKQLLRPGGFLIQWDWLKAEHDEGAGFSQARIEHAFEQLGFSDYSLSFPFAMGQGEEAMPVVMVVAHQCSE